MSVENLIEQIKVDKKILQTNAMEDLVRYYKADGKIYDHLLERCMMLGCFDDLTDWGESIRSLYLKEDSKT